MPQTGQTNTLFGVYASACCGREIVIPVGTEFPPCPNHQNVNTTWDPIEVGPKRIIVMQNKTKPKPAAFPRRNKKPDAYILD